MNYKKTLGVVSLVLLLLGLLIAPVAAQDDTIVDIAAGNEDFSTLVTAVTAAGLGDALSGEGPFTVFAPTNDAFAAALEELGTDVATLAADVEALTGILTYHVVEGAVLSTDLSDGMEVTTLNGATFTVNIDGDAVTLTDGVGRVVNVVDVDIEASNGVIHVIDNVLLPPPAEEEEEAEEEAPAEEEEMAEEEMVEETLYTVPEGYEASTSDDAATLTSEDDTIIVYTPEAYAQVLSTQEFESDVDELVFFLERVGYSTGLEQDALPSGATAGVGTALSRRSQVGVGYLYDLGRERFAVISLHEGRGQVGAPTEDVETVVSSFEYLGTIVDLAIESAAGGNEDRAGLSLLVAAVQSADPAVLETLSGEGNFTVFAPTNQAFINLFAFLNSEYGLSQSEVLASQDVLTAVLLYHVVEGDIFAEDVLALEAGSNVSTLLEDPQNGIVVGFRGDGTPILNGSVDLVTTDILASNGVIHVIDDVLLPLCVVETLEGTGTCGNFGGGEAAADGE